MADPHVISAPKQKRAELSGELIAAEKRILQLRADIASLDRKRYHMDAGNMDAMNALVAKVRNALARQGEVNIRLRGFRDAVWLRGHCLHGKAQAV